jgi:flagellar basal-body rod protein FlgF
MDLLMLSAASGMQARMESLDMLANNVANTSTSGFKADNEFYTLYKEQEPFIETHWTDFSQGLLTQTNNPLNLALAGPGFFAVTAPTAVIYTRSGHFRASQANQLVSPEGYPLRDVLNQGRPIVVDPAQPIAIEKTGEVVQGGQTIAQIQIDQLPAVADATAKLGNMYFSLRAQPATPTPAAPVAPVAASFEVQQGFIEESNVPVADSAVRLITIMRQFEMLQKAMNLGAQMDKESIEDVAKPS